MQTITLPGATTPTSRIGLGCGRLAGGAGFRAGAAVIEAALAAGVRHFDVAPSYGLGLAEGVLGQVIGTTPGTSVTTKAGIAAPQGGRALSLVRQLVRPLVSGLPGMKARLVAAASAALPVTTGNFAPHEIQASLNASLKALRRDRIDVFLLHEPPASTPDAVECLLDSLRARGPIGAYGAGTGGEAAALPVLGQVAQYAWTPKTVRADERTGIQHGAFRNWLPRLRTALPADVSRKRALSIALGFDLDDADALPSLLLTMALSAAPNDLFLISSSSPHRLTRVVGGVDWSAVRGERPAFIRARDHLLNALAETADV